MSVKFLEEFFTCPICIEILNDPLTTVCGHNYCKSCVRFNLHICPMCKKEVNFSQLNINFQLKNIIDSIRNLDKKEFKTKFFPEIKEEDENRNKELRLLISNIFGEDFLCNSCQCREIIKNLLIRILSNKKENLTELINCLNRERRIPQKDRKANLINNGNINLIKLRKKRV